jgi:hypothetical protein
MCERCDDTLDRRDFLRRAAVGGAAMAGAVLLPEALGGALAGAATPPVETVGLGEDLLPPPRALPEASLPRPAAPRPAAPKGLVAPPIVSRAQWGANEAIRTSQRAYAPVRKLVVHHTASPTNPADPVGWVRKTYEYHVLGRGYSDVGYNFLIDHRGRIYEGRWAREYAGSETHTGQSSEGLGVIGGHALGMNTGSVGICLIGDFTKGRPTQVAINSLVWLLAWECWVHQIDPMGSDRYVSLVGVDKTFPNICGHRDVGNTICPGPAVFNLFPAIRKAVRNMVGSFPAQTVNFHTAIRYNYVRGATPASPAPTPAVAGSGSSLVGYRILTSDGRVTSLGKAAKARSPRDEGVTAVLALAGAPGAAGYYSLDAGGGVLAFGTATWHGSLRAKKSTQTPVDLTARRQGDGYWVLAANGGVFPFGAAQWYGSLSGFAGRIKVRKVRASPTGRGYWILAANGRVYPFGDAGKAGSPADHGRTDVVDLAPTASGKGYWVVLSDGGVLAHGDAQHHGDLKRTGRKPVAIMGAPNGQGYQILSSDGAVKGFGNVATFGGVQGRTAVALAPTIV